MVPRVEWKGGILAGQEKTQAGNCFGRGIRKRFYARKGGFEIPNAVFSFVGFDLLSRKMINFKIH